MAEVDDESRNEADVGLRAGSIGTLLISYLLCRYLFFELHGMKSFPFYLLCAGIAIGCRGVFHAEILFAAAAVGYISGFYRYGVRQRWSDPGGGRTCGWLIW